MASIYVTHWFSTFLSHEITSLTVFYGGSVWFNEKLIIEKNFFCKYKLKRMIVHDKTMVILQPVGLQMGM